MRYPLYFLFVVLMSNQLFGQEWEHDTFPQKIYSGNLVIEQNEWGDFGVVDKKGEEKIPFKFHRIIATDWGLIVYKINKSSGYERTYSCGFYSKKGVPILACSYNSILANEDGTLIICETESKKYGLVDTSGRILIETKYDELLAPSDDLICAKLNSKYGYINRKNKIIIPFQFNFASRFSEGLAAVTKNKLIGFINTNGQQIVQEQFSGANPFHKGYSEVFVNQYASCIDSKGIVLFPFIFNSVQACGNDLFIVDCSMKERHLLSEILINTPINTKISETELIETESDYELDDLKQFSDQNFQCLINSQKQIIGGTDFRLVEQLLTEKTKPIFVVQSIQEIEQSENWNYAILNQNGKICSDFMYYEVKFDPNTNRIIGLSEINNQIKLDEFTSEGEKK